MNLKKWELNLSRKTSRYNNYNTNYHSNFILNILFFNLLVVIVWFFPNIFQPYINFEGYNSLKSEIRSDKMIRKNAQIKRSSKPIFNGMIASSDK